MNNVRTAIAALALATVFVGGLAPKAFAQDDPSDSKITIQLTDADVREAIRMLFKGLNVSYEIAQDVQGTVTVDYNNVAFATALRGILNQVKATYKIETGIYKIMLREESNPVDTGTETTTTPERKKEIRRIQIKHADPMYIYYMLVGGLNFGMSPEMSVMYGGNSGYGNSGNGGYGNGGYGNSGSGYGSGSSGRSGRSGSSGSSGRSGSYGGSNRGGY